MRADDDDKTAWKANWRGVQPVVTRVASECDLYGHEFEVLSWVHARDPKEVVCYRCGMSWKVER